MEAVKKRGRPKKISEELNTGIVKNDVNVDEASIVEQKAKELFEVWKKDFLGHEAVEAAQIIYQKKINEIQYDKKSNILESTINDAMKNSDLTDKEFIRKLFIISVPVIYFKYLNDDDSKYILQNDDGVLSGKKIWEIINEKMRLLGK